MKKINMGEKILAVLEDEEQRGREINAIINKGPYGLYIDFSEDEDDKRSILIDFFDNKLSVKVWDNSEDEDFAVSIPIERNVRDKHTPLKTYVIESNVEGTKTYKKEFYNNGECYNWIIETLDLSKNWVYKIQGDK